MDDSRKRKAAPKSMEELQQAWSEAPCSVRRGYRNVEIVPVDDIDLEDDCRSYDTWTDTPEGRNHLGEMSDVE